MFNSMLAILVMAGIGIVRCHPHPGVASLGGGYGVTGLAGGYGVAGVGHGSGYGTPAAAQTGGGYGVPAGSGHGGGGSVYQSVGAGGLFRTIGSALFGSIVHSPGIQVSHSGYGGGGHANGPSFGKTFGFNSGKGILGGFNAGNPHKGGGLGVAYGLPVATGHDNAPWRPIKTAPVNIVLSKPAHVDPGSYGGPVSYETPVSYVAAGPSISSYSSPVNYKTPVSYVEAGAGPSSYGAPVANQIDESYSQQKHMSVTPSMSFGYSYKLVPTYAYGPTMSGGEGSGVGKYGH